MIYHNVGGDIIAILDALSVNTTLTSNFFPLNFFLSIIYFYIDWKFSSEGHLAIERALTANTTLKNIKLRSMKKQVLLFFVSNPQK